MTGSPLFAAPAVVVVIASLGLAAPLSADNGVVGIWQTEPPDAARIKIEKSAGRLTGTLVWLEEPDDPETGKPKVDQNNPRPSERGRAIVGIELMRGFQFDGAGVWSGGTIYDPASGKTYKCKITQRADGTLHVRGYVGFSLLGRTTVWTRAAEESD